MPAGWCFDVEEGRGRGYRFVSHTADIEFVAEGKDVEGMFRSSLTAMFDTIADLRALSRIRERPASIKVAATGADLEELLWRTLQDALSRADAGGLFAYKVVRITYKHTRTGHKAYAVCAAKKKTPAVGKFDVKGVSRFDLKVTSGRRIRASVVLDV